MSDSQEADVSAINDLRRREIKAAEAGDVEGLLSIRTEDFTAMPPGQDPVCGKQAVSAFLSGMFEQVSIQETVVSDDIVVSGELAYDRGTFTGSATPKAGGDPMELNGKYLWIARREEDGSWRYAVQMWSDNS